jgi:hypothetical protein
MTLNELLFSSYDWADQNAPLVLAVSLGIPVVGTLLAFIGKGGKTDEDGRLIASLVMGVSMLAVMLEVVALFLARSLHDFSPLDANAALLAAPILCLVGSAVGVRLVFPLSELGSVRTALDLAYFLAACGLVVWFFSMFRGWSIVFFGTFTQLIVVGIITLFFLRRMFRRTFGLDRGARPASVRSRYDFD